MGTADGKKSGVREFGSSEFVYTLLYIINNFIIYCQIPNSRTSELLNFHGLSLGGMRKKHYLCRRKHRLI